jgi:ketosteroid isomerase-like protein
MTESVLVHLKRAWESGNADAAARLYSQDALFEDGVGPEGTTVRGREAIRTAVRQMFAPTGARFEVSSLSPTREGGVAEWRYSWPAERRGVRNVLRGTSVIVIRRSRVVRESSYYDPVPEVERVTPRRAGRSKG